MAKKIKKCQLCDSNQYYENKHGQIIHACTQPTLMGDLVSYYVVEDKGYRLIDSKLVILDRLSKIDLK